MGERCFGARQVRANHARVRDESEDEEALLVKGAFADFGKCPARCNCVSGMTPFFLNTLYSVCISCKEQYSNYYGDHCITKCDDHCQG